MIDNNQSTILLLNTVVQKDYSPHKVKINTMDHINNTLKSLSERVKNINTRGSKGSSWHKKSFFQTILGSDIVNIYGLTRIYMKK